jgi:hypothetical protein
MTLLLVCRCTEAPDGDPEDSGEIEQSESIESGDDSDTEQVDGEETGLEDTGSGEDTGIIDEPEGWTPTFRGTWLPNIKDISGEETLNCRDGGWWRDDPDATRDALLASNQNLVGGYIEDGSTDSCYWLSFLDLLESIEEEDGITIIATVERDTTPTEMVEAIHELRLLRVEHPELRALLHDDANTLYDVIAWDGTLESVLVDLVEAAHDTSCADDWCAAPELELWPYLQDNDAGWYVVPGADLALLCTDTSLCSPTQGYAILPDGEDTYADVLGFHATWNPGGKGTARLEVVQLLITEGTRPNFTVTVQVGDDDEVLLEPSESTTVNGQLRLLEGELPSIDSDSGSQTLTFRWRASESPIDADSLSRLRALVVRVVEDEQTTLLEPDTPFAWRDSGRTDMATAEEALVASTNEGLRLDHLVDGMALQWRPGGSPNSYDAAPAKVLWDEVCAAFAVREGPCLTVQWGNDQWSANVPASLQGTLLELVPHSEGLLLFRHELSLTGAIDDADGALVPPDLGIFAALQPPKGAGYEVLSYWPRYTRGVPGYARQHLAEAPCTGEYSLSWSGTVTHSGRFNGRLERIAIDGSVSSVIEVDVGDAEEEALVFEAEEGEDIRIVFEEIQSVGSSEARLEARVTAPDECGGLPLSDWTQTTHVSENQAGYHRCYSAWFAAESPQELDMEPLCISPE